MNYQELDMSQYKRKGVFEYFNTLAYPYVGLTVNIDITDFYKEIKERKYPFFLSFCYCVAQAANSIAEFRQRIQDGKIIEFDYCRTSHTVALEDETFCFCTLESNMPFAEYLPEAIRQQEYVKQRGFVKDTKEELLEQIFISTLPWCSYTSLIQPVPMPADSNPRITWGKYFTQEGKMLLPVSILCHHGLIDGQHIAKFYEALEKKLTEIFS